MQKNALCFVAEFYWTVVQFYKKWTFSKDAVCKVSLKFTHWFWRRTKIWKTAAKQKTDKNKLDLVQVSYNEYLKKVASHYTQNVIISIKKSNSQNNYFVGVWQRKSGIHWMMGDYQYKTQLYFSHTTGFWTRHSTKKSENYIFWDWV